MRKTCQIAVLMTGIKNQFDIEEDKVKNKINVSVGKREIDKMLSDDVGKKWIPVIIS